MGRVGGLVVLVVMMLAVTGGGEARAATASTQVIEADDRGREYVLVLVSVAAEPGESNDVTLTRDGQDVLVRDGNAPLRAGAGCVAEGAQVARCGHDEGDLSVGVLLGDGDDRLLAPAELVVRGAGGEGDDVLEGAGNTYARFEGGPGADTLVGGDGTDSLTGGEGADRLLGGRGDDDMVGDALGAPPAPDVLDGGEGSDSVDYSGRPQGIVVDLAAGGPAGAPGEGDRLTSVEEVSGGEGDDVLRGGPAAETLRGAQGDDVLNGGGGDDEVDGNVGIDHVAGGEGDDRVLGGERDTLESGAGDDAIVIRFVRGEDDVRTLACGPGDDLVSGLPDVRLLPEDCEDVDVVGLTTSQPRMIDGHPRFDVTRGPFNPPTCRVRVEMRTFGGRLLARGAKRTGGRDARVTAVLTRTGRSVLLGREKPVRVAVTFRRASCRGGYGLAGRLRTWL